MGSAPDGAIRVLVAIKGLASGGAERLLVDAVGARDVDAFDYEVASVLATADALAPAVAAQGVAVRTLGATANVDLRWVPRFRRLVADGGYDIVHFHLPYTAALGRPAVLSLPRRSRPVTLYTEHSLWNRASPLVKALNRLTIGADRALLCVSEPARAALPPALRDRAEVVVHGIDQSSARRAVTRRPEIRARLRAELDVADGELLVVTVAGLRAEKGYDVLLDAASLALARRLPLRFVSAGGGSLAAEFEGRRVALALGSRFRFLGHRGDAVELMAAADIFVLPSRQEGLPVVLMEATSVGAPIVATRVGGVPEIIEDGVDGLLVAPGDPMALADAVARLADDPALRERLAGRAIDHRDAFVAARSTARIEALYRRLVTTRRRAG